MRRYVTLVIFSIIFIISLTGCEKIQELDKPPIVEIVSPVNGATGVSLNPVLKWSMQDPEGEILSVKLYLSEDKSAVDGEKDSALTFEGTDVQEYEVEEALKWNTTYYWKVVVSDGINNPVRTNVASFKTAEASLEIEAEDSVGNWLDSYEIKWNLLPERKSGTEVVFEVYLDDVKIATTSDYSFSLEFPDDRISFVGTHTIVVSAFYEAGEVASSVKVFEVYHPGVMTNYDDGEVVDVTEIENIDYTLTIYDPKNGSIIGDEIKPIILFDGTLVETTFDYDEGEWHALLPSVPGGHEVDIVLLDADSEDVLWKITRSIFFTASGEETSEIPRLNVYVVEYNMGPSVEDAVVLVYNSETGELVKSGVTNSEGFISFTFDSTGTYDIKVAKYGFAPSVVKGLKISRGIKNYKIILKKANLEVVDVADLNEYFSYAPQATVEFYTDSSKATPADLENVRNQLYVKIEASGKHLINIIYAAVNKIPGAGFTGSRFYEPSTNTAEGYLDLSGANGETEIHIVVYDANDARVDYVFYANVIKESDEFNVYTPILFSDIGDSPNVYAYTRRQGVEFYSNPIVPKFMKSDLEKFDIKPLAAPKDSNLWNEVWLLDYDLALYYGLIPSSTDKPEGYAIYRSEDGIHWEKIGFLEDDDEYNLVFRDSDPRLEPGKTYHYAIRAVYPGGKMGYMRYAGYVVPLDVFNVDLISPEDGATGVSRDPTFVWKPTNDAFAVIPDDVTYDGTYTYTLWIYDLVQSENHLFPYDPNSPFAADGLPIKLFASNEANQMSLQFSDVDWAIIVNDLGGAYLYSYDKLEPNKTYEWAVDLAVAYAIFGDNEGVAYSIAIDEGYGADYFGVHSDIYNTFTTGQE